MDDQGARDAAHIFGDGARDVGATARSIGAHGGSTLICDILNSYGEKPRVQSTTPKPDAAADRREA